MRPPTRNPLLLLLILAVLLHQPAESRGSKKKKMRATRRAQLQPEHGADAPQHPTLGAPTHGPPKGPAASWSAPYLGNPPSAAHPLVRTLDGALPEPLLAALHPEAATFWEKHRAATHMHSKKSTTLQATFLLVLAALPRQLLFVVLAAPTAVLRVSKLLLGEAQQAAGSQRCARLLADRLVTLPLSLRICKHHHRLRRRLRTLHAE